ncbi:hypothetical protein [Aquipuribacter sp. SD81]|uniref:hypothetical protein n=1 Tax=Aquipuribacter sp. SD81 TaxID=3127703 RepID=UPI0030198284
MSALGRPPAEDPLAVHAACSARALEREGIPMVLVVRDARAGAPDVLPVADERERADGAVLAGLLARYDDALAPLREGSADVPDGPSAPAPDRTGGARLIPSLVVLADGHLREDG